MVEFAPNPEGLTATERLTGVVVDVGETVSQEALDVTVNGVDTLADTERTCVAGVTPLAELKDRLEGVNVSVPPPPVPPPLTTSTTGKDTGLLAAVVSLMVTDDVYTPADLPVGST